MMPILRPLPRAVIAVLLTASASHAAPAQPAPETTTLSNAELRAFIVSKLTYDRDYFDEILRLESQGRVHPRLTAAEFAAEVKRARANQPVLHTLFKEMAAPRPDGMLSLPPTADVHREYSNLIGLMNMMHANERLDFAQVLRQGERLKVKKREDFGHVRGDSARYYVNLYRLYFFLMAFAHYSLGQDANAVEWLGRLEADANLAALKIKLGSVTKETARELRLDALRGKPVAVMPFACNAADKDLAWAEAALTEVLTTDLVQNTDLLIVERAQLDKVMDEVALGAAGFVQDDVARNIGKLSGAGVLLMGTFQRKGNVVLMSARLVDSEDARILAAETGEVAEADLFTGARALVLKLFSALGWADGISSEELLAGRAPDVATLKTLHQARLLMASKRDQARELFARAVKEDPAVANLYRELRSEFKDVSATLAVMDVANLSGVESEAWMARGVTEGLTADLPKLGFQVVERGRLAEIMEARAEKQALDTGEARKLGEQLGADFVVLGSILYQKPRIRVDVRFVDVRTGVIAQSASAESRTNDLMAVLSTLSAAIAAQFNHKLSADEIEALVGKKRNAREFEAFVRQEMARDALRSVTPPAAEKQVAPVKKEPKGPAFTMPAPSVLARIALYSAAALVLVTATLAVLPAGILSIVGLQRAAYYSAIEYQLMGVRATAEDEAVRQSAGPRELQAQRQAWGWLGLAGVGGAVMGVSVSVLVATAAVLAAERVASSVVETVRGMNKAPPAEKPAAP